MTVDLTLRELAGLIVAAAALLGALAYLGKRVRALVHLLDAILKVVESSGEVVERELERNHGSSMKDDVTAIAYRVGDLWDRVEALEKKQARHRDTH